MTSKNFMNSDVSFYIDLEFQDKSFLFMFVLFLLTSFVFLRRHCTFLLHSCGNEIKDRHLINVMSYVEALWYCATHKKKQWNKF